MLPILLDLRIIKIYTFGVFLLIAFFWALFWFWRNIKRTSFKEEQMFDGAFISLIGALIFSRLTYVLLNYNDFGPDILKFILINGYPGLSLIGALIGGFFTLSLFTRVVRLNFLEVVAYSIPSLFLAIGIGKIGAFFGGNEIGAVTEFPLAIQYIGYEGYLHIVPVYEAVIMFVGFYISQQMLLRYRRDKIHVGSIFSFFIMLVSLTYMSLDFIKGDILYLSSVRFNVALPAVFFTVFGFVELIKYRKAIIRSVQKIFKKGGSEA